MVSEPDYDDNYDEKIEKMVTMTVAAAKEIVPAGQVLLPLAQIANGNLAPPEARALARALIRIIKGERDPIALVEDLTPELTEVIWETLEEIEDPSPVTTEDPDEATRDPLTFEQLVEKVAEACSGDVMLWQRLWDFTEELSTEETAPSDIQTLGTVLRKILAGERQKHVLPVLSNEHRWAVEQLLDWLNRQGVEPKGNRGS
jgi:hypothetical protein